MAKFVVKADKPPETITELWLEQSGVGVDLRARAGGTTQTLMTIDEDGFSLVPLGGHRSIGLIGLPVDAENRIIVNNN